MSEDQPEQLIRELGIFGLKTLIAMNAGAAVVLIGFVGSSLEVVISGGMISLAYIKWSMFMYVAGLASAMAATLATYILAQMQTSNHGYAARLTFAGFISWMIVFPILSFVFFAVGSVFAILSLGF